MKHILNQIILSVFFATQIFGAAAQVNRATYNPGTLAEKNFVINPNCEKNIFSITNSASGLSSTPSPLEADAVNACRWNPGSTGTLKFALLPLDEALKDGNCMATFATQSTTTGDYGAYVDYDGVNVSGTIPLNVPSGTQQFSINIPCNRSATTRTVVMTALQTPSSALIVGKVHFGLATNLSQISQSYLVGTVSISACSSAWTTSSATVVSLGTKTSCVYSVTGGLLAPSTNLAGFRIANALPGIYHVIYNGVVQQSGTVANSAVFYLCSGANTNCASSGVPSASNSATVSQQEVTLPVSGSVGSAPILSWDWQQSTTTANLALDVYATAGSASDTASFFGVTNANGLFSVYYYPSQSQIVASINAGPGITDWVQYTPTIVGFGTPSSVGFYSRRVGDSLEIKGSFVAGTPTAVAASVTLGYNGVNANVTAASSAKIPAAFEVAGFGGATSTGGTPYCAILAPSATTIFFGVGSGTTACFVASAANGNTLLAVSAGFSFHALVPIAGWTSPSVLVPLTIGSISSNSAGMERVERAHITCVSGPTVNSQSGSWISSVAYASSVCTLTIASGMFSAAPSCIAIPLGNTAKQVTQNGVATTTTSATFAFWTGAGVANDSQADIICMGPR